MNLTANADFSNLVTSVNRVTASLLKMQEQIGASNRILTGQIAATNKAFSETLRQTGQFGTHFVTLSDDVTKFGGNLDKGQLKLRDYYGAWQQHAKTSGGLIRQLAQQQVQLQNAILQPLGKNAQGLMQFNVQVPKGLDVVRNKTALASQELKIMNKVMQEGANQMINWGKNTQWAGRQLTVGLTVPIAAFGMAASKAFKEADQELVRLTKVYGGVAATSAAELGKIRKEVSLTAATLAKEYGASYKDTIGLAADLAATGKQGNDLLKATAETTRLMVLGEVDRQDAMKATLTIQNTFKQNTKELAESVNFLNAVENQTSLTIQDLTEAIPKAGPVVKALGGDVKDLALYLTAMKEGGIGAAEGANAIKSAFASMINPTKVATEQFKSFGIDLQGMVKKNTGNTTQMLVDLQTALDRLDPLSKSKAIEQLFGKFQFARMTALIDNLGKQGSQSLQVLDLLKQSTSDIASIADRELKQVTESASGKYRRAVEGLKADLAGIGDEFLRVQTFFVNVADKIVKFINILPGPIKSILTFLTGLTAIAGPLIMLTGVMANFIGYVIKGAFHFKSLFKSGEGWRMLTPEILAAQKAGSLIEKTFYSDAKAALSLAEALQVLEGSYATLQAKMNMGAVPVNPTISTLAGSVVVPGVGAGPRVVDPNNPLVGKQGTRASAHINPLRGRTQQQIDGSTIFGFVPGPIPVNNALKDAPQIYSNGDLPNIPGLTSSASKHGPVSTGIVAAEATKWQTLMGTLSMMSKTEVSAMKKQIHTTGTVSDEFMTAYSSLLPQITSISEEAVIKSAAIVSQVKSGELGIAQARERLIQLNYQIESAMGQATTGVATSLGRTANLTAVPGIDQPIVDPKGKSNMRQLFGKGNSAWVDKLAGVFGVKTWGASYSTHTTRPKRLNSGGRVYDPSRDGNIVPGDTSINYDNTPAKLHAGGFILNQDASRNNPDLVNLATNGYQEGGPIVPALLTPGETYFPPSLANQIMPTLEKANGGSRIQLRALGGLITPTKTNYGRPSLSAGSLRGSARDVLEIFGLRSPKMEFGPAGEKLGRFNSSTGLRAKVLSLVGKPATGLYGKIPTDVKMPINPKTGRAHTLESLNELMAGSGLSGENLRAYLLTLRAAERNGAIHGSTSQFLNSIPEELLSKKDAIRIAQEIDATYMQAVAGMDILTDSNNPYHSISKSAILAQNNMNLGKMWSEYSRQLSGLNPLYESDLASGRGHSNSAGARVIKITDPRDPSGKKKIKIGKLSGSNADNSMFFHSANSDWENYYGLNQFVQPVAANMGGLIGGKVYRGRNNYGLKLPASVIERLTAKWEPPRQFYKPGFQYKLGNQDPLHGPLQIGMSNNLKRYGSYKPNDFESRQQVVFKDDQFSRINIMDAFLTGTAENRGKYATAQYMSGNLNIMGQMEALGNHPLGPIAAMKTLQKKFTGKLYRGLIMGKTHNSLPEKLIEDIRMARATGDYSNLIGQEFIMRRSSWSKNQRVGSAFAPGYGVNADSILLEAKVRNRNILPAGDMFPEKVFQAPYGQSWNKTRFGSGAMSEQEAIFGGKFKIVGFDNGKMQVETVVDGARENGGPVNSGRPYLVGENGPELFVPRNSGGIVPNYALGGKVKPGKTGYGLNPAATFIGKQVGYQAGFMAASALLSKVGVDPQKAYMGMFAGQIGYGAYKHAKQAKAMQAATGAGELAEGALKAEGALAKLAPRFVQLAGFASKAAGPIGLVVTGLQVYKMLQDNQRHNQEVLSTSFGLTAKTAKEAGVQLKSLNSDLQNVLDTQSANKSRAALSFGNDASGVSGISLTVKQLKDMESSVKKTMPSYVEAFKKMTGKDIALGAERIKTQWVSMGMNAQEANAKIYTLIKLTHGESEAIQTMNGKAFQSITDQATAAKESINLLSYAIRHVNNLGSKGVSDSFTTFLRAQTSAYDDLVSKAKASGDKNPLSSSLSTLQQQYAKNGAGNLKLPEGMITELSKTDPLLASILTKTDTVASGFNKWIIATSGVVDNLSKIKNISVPDSAVVAKALLLTQDAVDKALLNDSVVGPVEKRIASLNATVKKGQAASVGMSVVDQISSKKKIKSLEDSIKKINEEAAARKKALDQQISGEDTLNQIKKKQLEYQQALAAGDMAAATQAQLDIQQLTSNRQTEMAKNAIDIQASSKTGPLQEQIDKLNAALNSSADSQALASDALNRAAKSLNDLIPKQQALSDALNTAINNRNLNGGPTSVDLRNLADAYGALAGLKKNAKGSWLDPGGKPIDEKALFDRLSKATTDSMTVSAQSVVLNAVKIAGGEVGAGVGGEGRTEVQTPASKEESAVKAQTGKGEPKTVARPGTTVTAVYLSPDPKYPPGSTIPNYLQVDKKYAFKDQKGFLYNGRGEVFKNGVQVGVWYGVNGNSLKAFSKDDIIKKAMGGLIKNYGEGGDVSGPGTETSDSIPAMLSDGEYVIRAAAVDHYGVDTFDALNAKKFKDGGPAYSNNFQGTVKPNSPQGVLMDWEASWKEANKKIVKIPVPPIRANFSTNSFELSKEQRIELQSIAQELVKQQIKSIVVQGHADSRGGVDNDLLSLNRAKATAAYLAKLVEGVEFIPVGHGVYKPLVPNTSPENMAQNRRAELFLPDQYKTVYPEYTPEKHIGMLYGGGKLSSNIGSLSGGSMSSTIDFGKLAKLGFNLNPATILAKKLFGFADGGIAKKDGNLFSRFNPANAFASVIQGMFGFGASKQFNKNVSAPKMGQSEVDLAALRSLQAITGYTSAFNLKNKTSPEIFGHKSLGVAADVLGVMPILGTAGKLGAAIRSTKVASAGKVTDSIFNEEIINVGEDAYKAFTIGKDKTKFTFKGAELSGSGRKQGIVDSDLSSLTSVDDSLFVVPTTPQGLIEAALKLNPKDKTLLSLLENFKNKNYGPAETELLDLMTASSYINKENQLASTIDTEGLSLVIAHLAGNKAAIAALKTKKAIIDDIMAKEKAGASANFPYIKHEGPLEPNQVPVIHSTSHALEYDANGNIIIRPAGYYRVGEGQLPRGAGTLEGADAPVPRPTIHTTLYGSVADHMYGQWSPANKKIVSTLEGMIGANGKPYSMNPTDTWWSRSPGESLMFPKETTAVISPFTDEIAYTKELIKRGVIKDGDALPVIAKDPNTNEVLHLSKQTYSSEHLQEIRDMMALQGKRLVVEDGKLMTELRSFGETQLLEMGSPSEYLDQLAIQLAKEKLNMQSGPVHISGHSLSSSWADEHVKAIAADMKVPFLQHQGSSPQFAEFPSGFQTQIMNRGGYDYSDPVTMDSLRYLALHGHYPTPKTSTRKSLFDDDDYDYDGPRLATGGYIKGGKIKIPGFAGGAYVNPTYSANMSIPKFENGINSVPVDMLAQLHKNEAVIPANMNPFNPNANNATISGAVYNVGNVTMNFAEAPANGKALFAEFKDAMRIENSKVGGVKEFGSKVMN